MARTARFTRLCKVSSCGLVHSLYTFISEEEDYRTIFKQICYFGIWFGHGAAQIFTKLYRTNKESQDAETYVQESGRAGKGWKTSYIILIIKQPHDLDWRCQFADALLYIVTFHLVRPLYFLLSLQHVFVVKSVGQHVNAEIVTTFNVCLCCESKLYTNIN